MDVRVDARRPLISPVQADKTGILGMGDSMGQPRIGIWICDCKGMISDHVDTERVEDAARQLGHASVVNRVDTLCSAADMKALESEIQSTGTNRVLFGGCSARTSLKFPEEQLTAVMHRVGMDKAFFGVANLRDFADRLEAEPAYITQARAGAGFAELADAVLEAR